MLGPGDVEFDLGEALMKALGGHWRIERCTIVLQVFILMPLRTVMMDIEQLHKCLFGCELGTWILANGFKTLICILHILGAV